MNENELKQFICEKFLRGDTSLPIDRNTELLAEGICDSLALVQIACEVEKRCPGVVIRDQEITRENFGSIGQVMNFLATKGIK